VKFKLIFFSLLLGLSVLNGTSQNSKVPDGFCISQLEYSLFQMINQHRERISLPPIPLSNSLCYVAKTHAKDLSENYPFGDDCKMLSWSSKGNWKPFCYPAEQNKKNDIKDKAKEISGYPGKAWEITYWENTQLDLNFVLEFWLGIPYTANMINSAQNWAATPWKSIGVGIQDGYVLVWFGQKEDIQPVTVICETGEQIQHVAGTIETRQVIQVEESRIVISENKAFYIIIGSFNRKSDADSAVKGYKEMGYSNAVIVEEQGKIRVAIDRFISEKEAGTALTEYRKKFQGAWIFSK
jgi:hypothetical protein